MPAFESGWIAAGVSFLSAVIISAAGYGDLNRRVSTIEKNTEKLPEKVTRLEVLMETQNKDIKKQGQQVEEIHKFLFENCDKRCQK